jgi:peptidoglycan/xylan/chitin deacetylase (PgdA/CDA1 family)
MTILLNRWRSQLTGGFILALHDITPERLSQLVDSIQPMEAVSLTELVSRSKRGKSTSGLFAITVDDGVGDTVRSLSQLFCSRGWPATFYVCTDYVGSAAGLCFQWWRRIMPLLPAKVIELKSGPLDLSKPDGIKQMAKKMEAMWHTQRVETYFPLTMELVDAVLQERGIGVEYIRPPQSITWPEITELSRNPFLCFESHGISHAAMSSLTEKELHFEMKQSRDLISGHTNRPCRHFAYPFGSDRSIGLRAAVAAELFYESAVTMSLGSVDGANPWRLPRIPLYPENPSWFANLKILLTCHRFNMRTPAGEATRVAVASPSSNLGNAGEWKGLQQ